MPLSLNSPVAATIIAAFDALAGASNRLKAGQAVANALGLAGGTYTIT
jgi:hypothetical protein